MGEMSAISKGVVSRQLPMPMPDGMSDGEPIRLDRYRQQYVNAPVRKQHLLADQGVYFVTNNAQTGIATPTGTSYSATVAMCIIANTDTVTATSKRIYVDNIVLVTTAAGSWASAGVNLQGHIYLDTGNRYSSGGTDISANIVSPNMDNPVRNSVAKVYFGNLTASSASGSARAICGLRILRPAVSATVADVVGETKTLNFGGVEASLNGSITVANANMISYPFPPIVIGPNQSMLFSFVMNGTTPGAVSYAPEISWWEF